MSSTSRPQTTGTSNIQSPTKTSQVESTTNPPQNVAQPSMYQQNNPNQQFMPNNIPNNIPLINTAQQLQFQSSFHQTAAFLQRQTQLQNQLQTQLLHHQQQQQQQQQQQPNSVESQIKNQQLANGPLAAFPNFPDLINLFLLQSNSNFNLPLPQPNQTQALSTVQQQPLQTPKTLPVNPSKLGQSQHSPRSAAGPKSVTNINTPAAEVNSTSTAPSVSEHRAETPKPAVVSPAKSLVASTISTLSSITSDRPVDEVKERTNVLGQVIPKTVRDESASNRSVTPPTDIVQDTVSSPETNKSNLPRRKQTATGMSPIKANPVISPSNPTGPVDSLTFTTPKKSNEVTVSPNLNSSAQLTPVASTSVTPTIPNTPPDKKVKQTNKEVTVSKSVKKNEPEPKVVSKSEDQKPTPSPAQGSSSGQESASVEAKSKRNRFKTNLFQCPTPDLVLATRMSVSDAYKNSSSSKDKLIIFYIDEFLAVRNDEGSFFLCQCSQNMYRTSKKCRVRWLNKVLNNDDTYELTFYDQIDKECILTSLELESAANNNYKLTQKERERIDNILKKSIDVEKGLLPKPEVTAENPDGLDISLYKSESQLELKANVSPSLKRQAEVTPKSVPTTKKAKKSAKASTRAAPNRRKNNSSSVESLAKSKKTSHQSKNKNVTARSRRSHQLENVKTFSIGPKSSSSDDATTSSRSNDESNTDTGKKKVDKTKKQTKSTGSSKDSPSTSSQQRSLRARSKK